MITLLCNIKQKVRYYKIVIIMDILFQTARMMRISGHKKVGKISL